MRTTLIKAMLASLFVGFSGYASAITFYINGSVASQSYPNYVAGGTPFTIGYAANTGPCTAIIYNHYYPTEFPEMMTSLTNLAPIGAFPGMVIPTGEYRHIFANCGSNADVGEFEIHTY